MCQNPVFPHNGYEVGCDADYKKVQKRKKGVERYVVTEGIGLYEFETDSAS